jgi:hypothetical protein
MVKLINSVYLLFIMNFLFTLYMININDTQLSVVGLSLTSVVAVGIGELSVIRR